jgi:serine/threonine-protein kinase HipA
MGRLSHTRALSVWMNGLRVATWRIPARGDVELQYDRDWLVSEQRRALSLSLPLGVNDTPIKGAKVDWYFENLLPDSLAIRRRIARRFRTESTSAFDLLEAIGRDCVGAVQLLAEDAQPEGVDRIEGAPMTEDEIGEHLQRVVSMPSQQDDRLDDDDFRVSLAGAQEKTALLFHEGRWMHPHGATPTTHILKLPIGLVGNARADFSTSVENEWLCMELLRAYGLPVANVEMREFAGQKALVVERFDRRLHDSGRRLLRLPQEDFCQALGVPPHNKYESDGGPGILDLAKVLQGSEAAHADRELLFASQILFWMLAATDGHAKNFSIRLLAAGGFQLTPIYDVVSIWPVVGDAANQWSMRRAKLAMAVSGKNRHYHLRDIQRRHFNAMALKCGWEETADPLIQKLIERTPQAIAQVQAMLPAGFPEHVAGPIFKGLANSAQRLARMPAA